jgi:hypothetical protein
MSERTDTKLRETKFFFQNLVHEGDKESRVNLRPSSSI